MQNSSFGKNVEIYFEDELGPLRNISIGRSIEAQILGDQSKFLNLKTIGICFNGRIFQGMHVKQKYFKDYLSAKCPKVEEIISERVPRGHCLVAATSGDMISIEYVIFRSSDNKTFY